MYKIKLTKNVRNKLIELGVYDKWFKNVQILFESYRILGLNSTVEDSEVFCKNLYTGIQQYVNNNEMDRLLLLFNWVKSEEGYDYWYNIYTNIVFKK